MVTHFSLFIAHKLNHLYSKIDAKLQSKIPFWKCCQQPVYSISYFKIADWFWSWLFFSIYSHHNQKITWTAFRVSDRGSCLYPFIFWCICLQPVATSLMSLHVVYVYVNLRFCLLGLQLCINGVCRNFLMMALKNGKVTKNAVGLAVTQPINRISISVSPEM